MRGDRLRTLREENRLTQKDVSDRTGISESQIYRYESTVEGRRDMEPRGDVIVKLADLFNVSTDYLHGVSDERGSFDKGELSGIERQAIAAWRRGDKVQAIKAIVGDE